MTDNIDIHKINNIKIKKPKKPKNSEKSQKIKLKRKNKRDIQITAYGNFQIEKE